MRGAEFPVLIEDDNVEVDLVASVVPMTKFQARVSGRGTGA